MIEHFIHTMREKGNAEKAVWQKQYHKSEREHFGVTVPECAQFAKLFTKDLSQDEILLLAKKFWKSNLFDPMMCASKMLMLPKISPSDKLWRQIVEFLKVVDGWALEDCLCHVAWKCILNNEKLLDEVESWTENKNFWMRRAALVYTLPYAKKGRDPERMLGWASKYVQDKEWFIQKAIGWWLRVLGEHNSKRVIQFLQKQGHHLQYVAKKEATRKLVTV